MSLDLSVIKDKKFTEPQLKSVICFLLANGFCKDQYGYRSEADNISLDVYINSDAENEEFWADDPPSVVWFTPLEDISLESRHTVESHEMNYHIAKELAKIVDGVIYDNQVGIVYDSDGKPFGHCKKGNSYYKYGSGMDLFVRNIGIFGDIIGEK